MKTKFVDLHNDAIIKLSAADFEKYIIEAEKAGVEVIFVSVWTTEMTDPLLRIKEYRQLIDKIKTKVKLLLHIEDAWFVDEANIGELIACKPYSVGLTWNANNALAGGAATLQHVAIVPACLVGAFIILIFWQGRKRSKN